MRIYDPRVGRFLSVDPIAQNYPWYTPYQFAGNNPIRFVDLDGEEPANPVRLIFYGGAISNSDNSTFRFAAKTIQRDYGSAELFEVNTAKQIVDRINSSTSPIQSIDIVSHGGTNALYLNDGGPDAIKWLGAHNQALYRSKMAAFIKGGGANFHSGVAYVQDIDYSKFTNDAKVELHGCSTCDKSSLEDNIAKDISERLYAAGKKDAVVIGHSTKANPNINGDKTTVKGQDYRHGERIVYHDGAILFSTEEEGRITGKIINKYLKLKEAQGDKYDGSKQVYKKP